MAYADYDSQEKAPEGAEGDGYQNQAKCDM